MKKKREAVLHMPIQGTYRVRVERRSGCTEEDMVGVSAIPTPVRPTVKAILACFRRADLLI